MNAHSILQQLLESAGITLNGPNPWDIQVHELALYNRILRGGSMALGESYVDGWWDAEQLDEFFNRVLTARLDERVKFSWPALWAMFRAHVSNDQTPRKALVVGERHYDLGNDLYQAMLGTTMAYTCGYWPMAKSLDQAQEAKFELVCQKLGLKSGMTILDIGSGWGSFARYAATHYGVQVEGITISKEQVVYAETACRSLPVRFHLCDYRQVEGMYDHIVSLGMFEHVGWRNYRTYMEVIRRRLKPNGLFLLHTIGGAVDHEPDPWIEKYIFPNGVIPSLERIVAASDPGWVMEDLHNFGADYDPTLMAWRANFVRHWPELSAKYGARFFRRWDYWLRSSAGSFRARHSQVWQLVFSGRGVTGGYRSIR